MTDGPRLARRLGTTDVSTSSVTTARGHVTLWGITEDGIAHWLSVDDSAEPGVLTGMAASPGVAEGPARVVSSPAQIDQVRDGEILVAPLTAPSWAPIFGKIRPP